MNENNSLYHYVILGAGKQGTAAAYDLARFGEASKITLADLSLDQALQASQRVNSLLGTDIIRATQIDVTNVQQVQKLLEPADVALSAVPYTFNEQISQAALAAQTSLCDMGGHTGIVRAQMALSEQARQVGISLVPDCGMGPGLVNTLGAYVIELLDEAREVIIYDAGLPQDPLPPWNYELTFHINGLTNEMDGQAVFIRDGKLCYVDTLSELEEIDFPPLGLLEADITSGGTSLAAWTYLGKLERYENKVLRYPGHYAWLKAFKTLGLFSEQPIAVNGQTVIPRQVYHALLEPKIKTDTPRDICIMRAIGRGLKDGEPCEVTVDLVDYYDPLTGFTGMERLTGWHCAIMMGFQARHDVPPGAWPVELAVPASLFMAEIRRRGIAFDVKWGG